jgi:uncharacterized membrane protein YdjX (TVP38/TMEM64 family)
MDTPGSEDGTARDGAAKAPRSRPVARLLPLLVLLVGLGLFFAFGLQERLTCAALRDNRAWLDGWVAAHFALAVIVFMAAYAAAVALSVPGAVVMTVAGGLLFGTLPATAMVVAAATAGATALFLAARTVFRGLLEPRAGPWLARLQRGFAANELSYLLVLRLVPLFPFFVVNLVPAFLGVRLRTFVLATFIGIIPGTLVFAGIGAGLGGIVDAGDSCSASQVLRPAVLIPLLALALLALAPVAYKAFVKSREARTRLAEDETTDERR